MACSKSNAGLARVVSAALALAAAAVASADIVLDTSGSASPSDPHGGNGTASQLNSSGLDLNLNSVKPIGVDALSAPPGSPALAGPGGGATTPFSHLNLPSLNATTAPIIKPEILPNSSGAIGAGVEVSGGSDAASEVQPSGNRQSVVNTPQASDAPAGSDDAGGVDNGPLAFTGEADVFPVSKIALLCLAIVAVLGVLWVFKPRHEPIQKD